MEGKTILVVDDEKKIRELLDLRLTAAGYRVLQAQHGEEGVAQARKHLPDLILMDVMMPRVDGPEAVRQLSEDPKTKSIPVIFLTAIITKDEEKNQVAGLQSESLKHRFISKPFDAGILLAEIRRELGG